MYSFILGIGIISGIYFISRVIENTFWILKIKFGNLKKYYLTVFLLTLIASAAMALVMYYSQITYLIVLIIIGIVYVVELDIVSEIKRRSSRNQAGQDNAMQGNVHDDHFF